MRDFGPHEIDATFAELIALNWTIGEESTATNAAYEAWRTGHE